MKKLDALQKQFHKAVGRLDEIVHKKKNAIVRDSAIKRFELTFDIAWKFLKTFLEEEKGIACNAPKECFRAAYQQGILARDEFWLDMTDLRNEAVHTYSEEFANALYTKLPKALQHFRLLEQRLREKA